MCGGETAALDRVRPLLELMGKHVFHLGPVGSGHAMKTVNNLATALTTLGTTEAMLIGKAYGLKPSVMLDVLNVSTAMSFMTQKRFGPQVVERRFDDAFKLELMLKDVGIANRHADEQGVAVPVSALGEQLWRAAHARTWARSFDRGRGALVRAGDRRGDQGLSEWGQTRRV